MNRQQVKMRKIKRQNKMLNITDNFDSLNFEALSLDSKIFSCVRQRGLNFYLHKDIFLLLTVYVF